MRPPAFPLLTLAAVWSFVLAAMALAWPFPLRALVFESGPVQWLQASLLCASAAVAVANGWYLLALGLFVMALDERFMGHETLKDWLLWNAFDGDLPRMSFWGDAPMALYPLGGAVAVRRLGRESRWFYAALAVGAAAIALDVALDTAGSQYAEEFLEATAEALFLGALLTCNRPRSSTPRSANDRPG